MDHITQEMIDRLLEKEGGYVFDPVDLGGETRFGISKRQYPTLDIRNLKLAQAREIYLRDYLRGPKIDQIAFLPLREQVFDFAVNSGPPQAIRHLQRLVGTVPDGLLGPKTLHAVHIHPDPTGLNNILVDARQMFLDKLVIRNPNLAKFTRGWRRRVQSFRLSS